MSYHVTKSVSIWIKCLLHAATCFPGEEEFVNLLSGKFPVDDHTPSVKKNITCMIDLVKGMFHKRVAFPAEISAASQLYIVDSLTQNVGFENALLVLSCLYKNSSELAESNPQELDYAKIKAFYKQLLKKIINRNPNPLKDINLSTLTFNVDKIEAPCVRQLNKFLKNRVQKRIQNLHTIKLVGVITVYAMYVFVKEILNDKEITYPACQSTDTLDTLHALATQHSLQLKTGKYYSCIALAATQHESPEDSYAYARHLYETSGKPGTTSVDPNDIITHFTRAAKENSEAQYDLSQVYLSEKAGINKNITKSLEYLKLAAGNKHPRAMKNLNLLMQMEFTRSQLKI